MLKIGIITDKNNLKIAKSLVSWSKKNLKKAQFSIVNKSNTASSILANADHAIQLVQSKKIDRLICVDDWGIAAFMYIAKFENFVVAEINDEHSAHMTTEHNNSNVLSFGSKLTTLDQMQNIITYFANATYEGARHKVRIDMMNELVGGCK